MGIPRRNALKRIESLVEIIEAHFEKLAREPQSEAAKHWRAEIRGWISQSRGLLPQLGRKTADRWRERIEEWETRLEASDHD